MGDMASKLRALAVYTACDISDALLKLKVPGAGFLPNINPYSPHPSCSPNLSTLPKLIAPASTVLMVPKTAPPGDASLQGIARSNIPEGTHYVDHTRSGTIVVTSQPTGQKCAVLGGIMAARMQACGAVGAVVGGRMRDLREVRGLGFPVWALGTSTMGTGAEAKAWAVEVAIVVQGITITPGDIMFCDPIEGVVAIPKDKLDQVIDILPKIVTADENVIEAVRAGMKVQEAFARYRS